MSFIISFFQVLSDLGHKELTGAVRQHIYEKRRLLVEYKDMLIKNGFGDIEFAEHSFNYRFADGTAMFDHPVFGYAFIDSWLSIVPEEKVNEIFNEIETRINKLSIEKGEWKVTIPYVIMVAYKRK